MKRVTVASLLLLPACAALRPAPPIVENRFRSEVPVSGSPAVFVSATTAEVEGQSGGVPITQLSDRGQAALIEQTKGKPPVQLKPGTDKPSGAVVLRNAIKRRVIVSILPDRFLPSGDRVDAIRVRLRIPPGQAGRWRISSWSQASNGQTVIEVGKLTGVSSSKITAETGLKIADFLPDFKVGGESARSETQEMQVRDATEFDAAVDASGTAWLVETAGWRADLAHNLSMDVVATTPEISTRGVPGISTSSLAQEEGEGKGQPTSPANVRLREITIYKPLEGQVDPVCAVVTLDYRIRHIANDAGRATFSESDDDVQYVEGTNAAGFLFAPPTYAPAYVIEAAGRELHYRMGSRRPVVLHFASLEEATSFRDWLTQTSPPTGRIANATLGTIERGSFRPLRPTLIRELLVAPESGDQMRQAAAFDPASCASAG